MLAGVTDGGAILRSDIVLCVEELLLMAVALIGSSVTISLVRSPRVKVSCAKPLHLADRAGCSRKFCL